MDRFWEIDFLRGIAIILMILFHLMLTYYYLGLSDINPYDGWFSWIGAISRFLFVFLVGVSLTLSHSRTGYNSGWLKYFARGTFILGLGIFVTIVTIAFVPSAPILFGILHFIGISIIIAYPFLRLTWQNILLGVLFVIVGTFLQNKVFDFWYFFPLGFIPEGFVSLDYFPIFPWFGIILFGICAGNILYKNYSRGFNIPEITENTLFYMISFLGRYSLLIYFIHEPLILLSIAALSVIT